MPKTSGEERVSSADEAQAASHNEGGSPQEPKPRRFDTQFLSALFVSVVFVGWLIAADGFEVPAKKGSASPTQSGEISALQAALQDAVFPEDGIRIAATWGSAIPELIRLGVIDRTEFVGLFEGGGETLTQDELAILDTPQERTPIVFSSNNARFTVDALWALGLAQQSDVLDNGPMRTSGTPTEQFASTGGWTLGVSDSAMDYYSKWNLLGLTVEDQARVTRIAETVYRPCCGNSTAFPDCNHGMAMLGLIELMVSQGASDDEIYEAAVAANTYWFPDTALEIAMYLQAFEGTQWRDADPRKVVGNDFSSGAGAQKVNLALREAEILPEPPEGGGSCGA